MFEGMVIKAACNEVAEEPLQTIAWSELVAKIAAAQDLRTAPAAAAVCELASFGEGAARCFAAQDNGKRTVNPEALSGRKSIACKADRATGMVIDGDREVQ